MTASKVRQPGWQVVAVLTLFAVVTTTLIKLTSDATAEKIANNERSKRIEVLHQLIPADMYDNDLLADRIYITDGEIFGTDLAVPVYQAKFKRGLRAWVFTIFAKDGYSGPISLLVGVLPTGQLLGVRVVSHRETPGLGDDIEYRKSPWIQQFNGRSLGNPADKQWAVKRDGGVFDQLTGATITPRAVVTTVRKVLRYYQENQTILLKNAATN